LPDAWHCSVTPRQAYVLRHYLGLDGLPRRTTQDIADELSISRQAVEQHRDAALRRLGIVWEPRSAIATSTVWKVGTVHGNRACNAPASSRPLGDT
jgi:hypothetical protein